jgi:hypothetical protein
MHLPNDGVELVWRPHRACQAGAEENPHATGLLKTGKKVAAQFLKKSSSNMDYPHHTGNISLKQRSGHPNRKTAPGLRKGAPPNQFFFIISGYFFFKLDMVA